MADLGTAYVQVVPSAEGIEGSLSSLFDAPAQSAGDSAGATMGGSMLNGLNISLIAGATAVVGAVAAIAHEAWGAINEVAEYGDMIDKQSQMMSLSTQAYQELSFAAERSGTSIDSFRRGIRNITNDLADFAGGSIGAADRYEALGVSLQNTDGTFRTSEEVLYDVFYALADMEDITQRNAAANDIFGRSYEELLPFLNSGSEGIQDLFGRFNELNGAMSEEGVAASAGFEDAMTNLETAVQGVKNNLAEGGLLTAMSDWINCAADWVAQDHPILEGAFEGLMGVVENVGETIGDLSYILGTVAEDIAPIIDDIDRKFAELESSIVTHLNGVSDGAGDMFAMIASQLNDHISHPFSSAIHDIRIMTAFAKGDYDYLAQEFGMSISPTPPEAVSAIYRAQINAGGTGFGSIYGSMGSRTTTVRTTTSSTQRTTVFGGH